MWKSTVAMTTIVVGPETEVCKHHNKRVVVPLVKIRYKDFLYLMDYNTEEVHQSNADQSSKTSST